MQQATGNPLAKFDLLSYEPVLSLATPTHWVTHADLADGLNDVSGLQELPVALFRSKQPLRQICSTFGSIKHWVLAVHAQFLACPAPLGISHFAWRIAYGVARNRQLSEEGQQGIADECQFMTLGVCSQMDPYNVRPIRQMR